MCVCVRMCLRLRLRILLLANEALQNPIDVRRLQTILLLQRVAGHGLRTAVARSVAFVQTTRVRHVEPQPLHQVLDNTACAPHRPVGLLVFAEDGEAGDEVAMSVGACAAFGGDARVDGGGDVGGVGDEVGRFADGEGFVVGADQVDDVVGGCGAGLEGGDGDGARGVVEVAVCDEGAVEEDGEDVVEGAEGDVSRRSCSEWGWGRRTGDSSREAAEGRRLWMG